MIQVEGTYLLLTSSYLSTQDDVNTISTSAPKRYSKCTKASHQAMEYLSIATAKKKTIVTKIITVAGLDYVKFKLHHFKRPVKTKAERNPHLSVKPKFIFRAE